MPYGLPLPADCSSHLSRFLSETGKILYPFEGAIIKVMEIFIIILLVVLLIGAFIGLFVISSRLKELKNTGAVELVKADVTELSRHVQQLQQALGEKVDAGNYNMQANMQRQLTQSAKLISDVTKQLTKLDETNRQVVDVASELKTLQTALQNPKQRGIFGEYYLKTVLENVLPPTNFQMQYKFSNGDIVDSVIFLDKNKILPIDSKFSLENYNKMVAATDKTVKEQLLGKIKNDLKNRIDETSKYVRPNEDTMDFAFMFIPSESLYYDLLVSNVGAGSSSRDLIEYAFRDKKVIIVSPTSFMAYLQTVLQGLRSLQIEGQAKEIQKRVGQLSRHLEKFDEYMNKLGRSLETTVNQYNFAHKELNKVDKDMVKIAHVETVINQLELDKPRQGDKV